MTKSINITARQCCSREKEILKQELIECDDNTYSRDERHACYRWAAKKSGQRSRRCLISG
ncbi:MAG: hypothetical protein K9K40_10405 [Desulfotignum sp.]|nr:hypothetical protein [Desulfotignum sp.]MCF8126399.1 hypothetical protein [Desulfotignum sp.]